MPRKQTLKVFRTPIGFHDAYVAAPSQKAALKAWGSDADLFARGVAERVDDPELMREPLAQPGKVVRRLRGTAAEQFAALPKDPPRRPAKAAPEHPPTKGAERRQPERQPKRPPAPKPRPSRAALDRAEKALADADSRHRSERDALARREAELNRERRHLEKKQEAEQSKLAGKIDAERGKYERAMQTWRG